MAELAHRPLRCTWRIPQTYLSMDIPHKWRERLTHLHAMDEAQTYSWPTPPHSRSEHQIQSTPASTGMGLLGQSS
eukprot:3583659-Alexandrium_andersonii.AAC.1